MVAAIAMDRGRQVVSVIGHVFPLDRAPEAYKLLQEGKNYGKIVLTI